MGEQNISIIGTADLQQIITGLHQINGQVLALNNQVKKQGAVTQKAAVAHKTAGTATKGHASAMAGLALRFVGYNLILNQVMGAQQKLVQFVQESITKYREFETRLAEISTILQEDVDQMDRFKAGMESLSLTYGQSTSDISKGLYDILSAAFSARDAMNLLNTSIKASIAGLSDVRTSVKIFTTVLNSYGKSAEQATHVSDVLFQSVVRGKFQFADLEQALGYVVPIAAQAGISFDDLSAALSTATRHGLHIDMTARGLALAIQGIINPSEKARKAALEYGVQMDGLSLRVLGLKGWFDQLGTAMDKYGKNILGELVPNMRSLRVAMVLAGEEGAKGFAEDLLYLESVSGRTEEALTKMMNTSEFISKQITQDMEKTARDIGSAWDEVALKLQGAGVWIAKHWQNMLPIIGPIFTMLEARQQMVTNRWKDTEQSIYRVIGGQEFLAHNLTNYLGLKKEEADLSAKIANLRGRGEDYSEEYEQLQYLISLEPDLVEIWNTAIGGIQDTQDELANLEITMGDIERDIVRLKVELEKPIEVGWSIGESGGSKIFEGTLAVEMAQLLMAQKLKDSQHDVKMALIDSEYAWKTNNTALQEAVEAVKAHEDAQKKDTIATKRMTIAMRLLQIEALEIQLSGMLKRRGLSRTEQKQLKQIQIEQTKLRLENMKATKDETVLEYDNYEQKKQFIAEFLAGLEEESYQIKYMYTSQIADLDAQIKSEKELLEERYAEYKIVNQKIFDNCAQLVLDVGELPAPLKAFLKQEEDLDVDAMVKSAITRRDEALKAGATETTEEELAIKKEEEEPYEKPWEAYFPENKYPIEPEAKKGNTIIKTEIDPNWTLGKPFLHKYTSSSGETRLDVPNAYRYGELVNFRRGTQYVPETMPIMAHKGESIIPAGRDVGGETIVNVNVTGNTITDTNVDMVARQISDQVAKGLIDAKTGKTKYGMR